ncbi:MAG: hypothetical protein A2Z02_04935 [Chloroflexi bacterium RBG_16_48_7]|nr:MAG: hypothetical protein A2Z02_04935 [Chloroflexi bacterium RBG_16_48_7]
MPETAVKNINTEIVIIGGGGAGLAAALETKENGAKDVIVLEKRGNTGGNTALSVGLFAVDSPAQKRISVAIRRDDMFKIAMEWAHWKINPLIVRAFLNKSGDTIRWFEAKGLKFECFPFYPNQFPLVWHQTKGLGAQMMKFLASECREQGVKIHAKSPAKKILLNYKGGIIGVAADIDGDETTITAKCVIIASGGYAGNKDLLKKYSREYHDNMECGGLPHTGDGLLMATEIGAATEGLGLMLLGGPGPDMKLPTLKIGSYPDIIDTPLQAITLEPNTLWVNRKGKRFVDETTGFNHFLSSYAANRQPGNTTFTLLDKNIVRIMTEEGLVIGFHKEKIMQQRTGMPGLERELAAMAEKGGIKAANTLEEIADWIGADRKVFKATIEEYNSACDHGYDGVMGKNRAFLQPLRNPPFYAIETHSGLLDTIGGIKINEKMEVLDGDEKPIPGLYAAGVAAGGWEADCYCAVLSGAASGFAINSGRIAAENACRFISGKN